MYLASLHTELDTLGVALEILAGLVVGLLAFGIVLYLLMIIAGWRLLKKAGEPGWKILIPIYNVYMLWKIAGMKNWWWAVIWFGLVVSILETAAGIDYNSFYGENVIFDNRPMTIISLIATGIYVIYVCIAQILYAYRTSKVFGHGLGYTLGLIIFPNLFWLILGFGGSTYDKHRLAKSHVSDEPVSRKTTTKTTAKSPAKKPATKSTSKAKTTKKSSKK